MTALCFCGCGQPRTGRSKYFDPVACANRQHARNWAAKHPEAGGRMCGVPGCKNKARGGSGKCRKHQVHREPACTKRPKFNSGTLHYGNGKTAHRAVTVDDPMCADSYTITLAEHKANMEASAYPAGTHITIQENVEKIVNREKVVEVKETRITI